MEFNATFLVSAISFIAFVFIMNAVCYKPIAEIVEKRQNFIDDTNLVAKNNLEESDKLIKDREEKINSTKLEAKKLIAEKTDEANHTKSNIQSEAQKNAVEKIESAKTELGHSRDEAQNVLSQQIDELAGQISSKILG